jgi:hypothetical protein
MSVHTDIFEEIIVKKVADEIALRIDQGEDARLIAEKVVALVRKLDKPGSEMVETSPGVREWR